MGTSPVKHLDGTSWRAWVREQLDPESINNDTCDYHVRKHFPSLTMSLDQVFYHYRPPYENDPPSLEEIKQRNQMRYKVGQELTASVIYRAIHSNRRFEEVMAEFWRNHFNVDQNKDDVMYLAAHYEQTVIRRHLFGKFGDMLLASARHPAMLIYLDNDVSQKPLSDREQRMLTRYENRKYQPRSVTALGRQRGLNENYARELMELHTLGVSSENEENGYTQRDVTELARLLTGWTAARQGMMQMSGESNYGFRFREEVHDDKPKNVLGMKFTGREGEAGGVRFIRSLSEHPATANFISLKLCRYLVNDNPPQDLVDHVAEVFVETQGDLKQVYEAILFSDAFTDPANYRCKFRTPFEFVIASIRATGAQVSSYNGLREALRRMGQPTYRCVDPTGYYDSAEAWLDPGVLIYRWDFALRLAKNQVPGVRIPKSFWETLPDNDSSTLKQKLASALFIEGQADPGWPALDKALGDKPKPAHATGLALGSPMFQQQ